MLNLKAKTQCNKIPTLNQKISTQCMRIDGKVKKFPTITKQCNKKSHNRAIIIKKLQEPSNKDIKKLPV